MHNKNLFPLLLPKGSCSFVAVPCRCNHHSLPNVNVVKIHSLHIYLSLSFSAQLKSRVFLFCGLAVLKGGQWVIESAAKDGFSLAGAETLTPFRRNMERGSSCGREVMTFWYLAHMFLSVAILELLARKAHVVSLQQLGMLHNAFCRYEGVQRDSTEVAQLPTTLSHSSFFSFSTGCWIRERVDNARHLLWCYTHLLPVEEAASPACPLIPNLCRRAGGLWTHGTCQTLPLYHCSCNGHTR